MADESNNKVVIEVVLDDGTVAKGFANIKKQGEESASFLSKVFKINGLADLNAGFELARKGFDLFKDSLSDGIKESLAGEKTTLQLATAMKSIPGVTNEAVRSFQAFSEELSKKIAVDDDVINSSAAVLASLGRLSGQGLKEATKAAADLSAGLGISLEDAASRIARAAEGGEGAFKKLGFQFTKNATDAQILQETLKQIEGRFSGLAQSIAQNTFEGVLNRLKVAFEDSNQALGDFVTKSPVVREVLKIIAESFEKTTTFLKSLSGQQFLNNIIIQFFNFASSVNTYLVTPLEIFYNVGKAIFGGFEVFLNGVVATLGFVGGKIAEFLNSFGIDNAITKGLETFNESTSAVLEESTAKFQGFKGVFETPVSDALGNSLDGVTARLQAVNTGATDALNSVNLTAKEMPLKLSAAAQQINAIYQNGILKTISASAEAIGASLIKGGDAFGDFKNTVLGIIGDMAIQIGQTLIGVGIGIENLRTSLATLTGVGAIAAGLALVAIGGLLKSLSGVKGNVSNGSPGVAAGVDISNPTSGGDQSPISTAESGRSTTGSVVVNISGDILGDEASGNRIVQLINSAFDTSGVNLRQGIV